MQKTCTFLHKIYTIFAQDRLVKVIRWGVTLGLIISLYFAFYKGGQRVGRSESTNRRETSRGD